MKRYHKELTEKYVPFAMEKQLFFADIVGKMNWNVNLDEGEISFDDNLFFPMQILGTFSHSSETWLWGWANSGSNIPENLLGQSNKLKEYGGSHNIDFLADHQFKIERDNMHYFGLLALGMFKVNGYYLGNYGGGTICLTISSKELDKKFPNDHHAIFTVFPQFISQYEVNHKEAFVNYLTQKGYKIKKTEGEIIGENGKNKVGANFDNLDRMIKLKSIDN